jgi:adhesin transport system outer membrane protein
MPQGASAQGVEDVVRRALDYHPAIKASAARKDAADERIRVERGGLLPSVNFRGSTGLQYVESPGTRGRGTRAPGSEPYTTLWRNEAGLFVTQLLWDGYLTRNTVEQARASALAAGHRVGDAREQTALQAVAAYIDILRNREFVRLAQINLGQHGAIMNGIVQQSRQGRATEADVSQARTRHALADSNLKLRIGQLREAEVRFEETVGDKAPTALRLPGLPTALARGDSKEWRTKAETQNFGVRVAEAEVRSREFAHKATAGLLHPRVEGEVSGRYGHNLDGVRGSNTDLRALLVVTWNLYRGGSDTARRRETMANMVAARYDADDARRAARERMGLALAQLEANRARTGPLTQRVAASQAVVVQYARQFEAGQRSLLDRLDVQNELFIAQAELADVRHTSIFNYYSVLAAAGELVASMGVR